MGKTYNPNAFPYFAFKASCPNGVKKVHMALRQRQMIPAGHAEMLDILEGGSLAIYRLVKGLTLPPQ
jgi:hypothetical protein